VYSPFGVLLKAVKDNEARAVSLGYDADRLKLTVFVLSAMLSGLAGALKTLALGFATLTDVHWHLSGNVLLMTLVGGVGTLSGPLVGAAVVIGLENKLGAIGRFFADLTGIAWFSALGDSVTMVTGLIFVICVLAFRRGIVGEAVALMQRLGRRVPAQAPPPVNTEHARSSS
ncbi:MAG TPA: branched-chain amino acid ABC transporter permease, partial [Gammaproteobacteria bacterium]|nr:branched-chain amino acid ABC transporter permease [Gammaproteobacteria bacterium]